MSVQSNNFIRIKIETYWVHNHEITFKEHARARDQEPSPEDQVNCSIPRSLLQYVSGKIHSLFDFGVDHSDQTTKMKPINKTLCLLL